MKNNSNRAYFCIAPVRNSDILLYNNAKGVDRLMFSITSPVVEMYRQEMGLKNGDALKLFCRYAGSESGLCIGVERGMPTDDDYVQEVDGIRFFVRPHETWFVEKMKMDYDRSTDHFKIELPSIA